MVDSLFRLVLGLYVTYADGGLGLLAFITTIASQCGELGSTGQSGGSNRV